jgi:hypothetical protein
MPVQLLGARRHRRSGPEAAQKLTTKWQDAAETLERWRLAVGSVSKYAPLPAARRGRKCHGISGLPAPVSSNSLHVGLVTIL